MNRNKNNKEEQSLVELLNKKIVETELFKTGYNIVVLGSSEQLNEVDWDEFDPELFLKADFSAKNSMFLNNVLDSLLWEMDSRISSMSMMGVKSFQHLISPPVQFFIVVEGLSKIQQLPLVKGKIRQLAKNGEATGFEIIEL